MSEQRFGSLRALWRRLPRLSARSHISAGLASLVSTAALLASFGGFVPDSASLAVQSRVALSESVSSLGSMLLRRGDVAGMRTALEVIVERNDDLQHIDLYRDWDQSSVRIPAADATEQPAFNPASSAASPAVDGSDRNRIRVPLLRGGREWGHLDFQFVNHTAGWLDWARQPPFGLLAFLSLLCFPMFYFYLGKVLKELDPSEAVPGRVRSALDTIAESLLVIDRNGDVVLANTAFAELTGQDPTKLVGQHIDQLPWVMELDEGASSPWVSALDSLETIRNDMLGFTDSTGSLRKFIVNCSPILGGGNEVNGVLISMDDVTELEEKEVLLRASMEAAEAANVAKSAFLSSMSHEIRTPMTAILGFTEVLRRGIGGSEDVRQKYLSTIHSSGQHLLELINDVLDLSKVESGAMEVEAIECKPALIAHEVIQVLNVKAREKNIDLDLQVHSDLPAYIQGDPSRLRQIVTNLAGNAIKFTDEGGVTIALVFEDDGQPQMKVRVTDSGIGMTEQQMATIFDAFTQADATINRRFGGTGLGLSISKKLAIAMGGDIVVSSQAGQGSTFTVTVPAGDISNAPILSPREVLDSLASIDEVDQMQWSFPESRILVVDDGPENRELLHVVLSERGIETELAENGKEGVDALAAGEFDVVLMDIQMPVMDGYQAVAEMRKRGNTLPIVALTANAMKGYEQRILESGFSHYMTKPIDLDGLMELLARLLGGQAEKPAAAPAAVPATGEAANEAGDERVDASVDAELDTQPIVSSLALSNPRFVPIAAQFITRLDAQLRDMRKAMAAGDWTTLAELGHWLKGSGGTVGFAVIGPLGAELEQAGKAGDASAVERCIEQIAAVLPRLQVSESAAPANDPTVVDRPEALAKTRGSVPGNISENPRAKVADDAGSVTNASNETARLPTDADSPVTSTLPLDNPRFRAIVDRFMPRLQDQLTSLQSAADANDMAEVAALAHWLKGSGGNVGYGGFVEFAGNLEKAANREDSAEVSEHLVQLHHYSQRVVAGWQQLPPAKQSA